MRKEKEVMRRRLLYFQNLGSNSVRQLKGSVGCILGGNGHMGREKKKKGNM